MEIGIYGGAMYATVAVDQIERKEIQLGDGILVPSEFVKQLGEKKRSSFEMQDGFYLRFEGIAHDEYGNEVLLFGVNRFSNCNWYYAFHYIDNETLLVASGGGVWDVRVKRLVKFSELPADAVEEMAEQLSFF
ncbi:hypothetical protein EDC32_1011279 [Laceyella sacchari]|jgi:hypothetical protein|uniref:hypothetical protein n=1 Tax=Laceyella sacchari TaxID=37482 RepID=UPI001053915A|nr:hypothetical protein [Laceyella sacchari]TCW41613.1 hypothetical protein EDC32_1011279 [Laceyella sacchari]